MEADRELEENGTQHHESISSELAKFYTETSLLISHIQLPNRRMNPIPSTLYLNLCMLMQLRKNTVCGCCMSPLHRPGAKQCELIGCQ